MKNANHPLVAAMRRNKKAEPESDMPLMMPKPMIDLHHKDLPSLQNKKPGDMMAVNVYGMIKSIHDDGRASMEVHRMKEDDDGDDDDDVEMKESNAPDKNLKEIRVTTQETHS